MKIPIMKPVSGEVWGHTDLSVRGVIISIYLKMNRFESVKIATGLILFTVLQSTQTEVVKSL